MKLPFVRTVNAHGLVTIPAKMRHELGWKPGTKLVISVAGSRFVLQTAKDWKKEQRQAKPTKSKRKRKKK
jgi:AbrB family looped-hinge helix DNA binding protein